MKGQSTWTTSVNSKISWMNSKSNKKLGLCNNFLLMNQLDFALCCYKMPFIRIPFEIDQVGKISDGLTFLTRAVSNLLERTYYDDFSQERASHANNLARLIEELKRSGFVDGCCLTHLDLTKDEQLKQRHPNSCATAEHGSGGGGFVRFLTEHLREVRGDDKKHIVFIEKSDGGQIVIYLAFALGDSFGGLSDGRDLIDDGAWMVMWRRRRWFTPEDMQILRLYMQIYGIAMRREQQNRRSIVDMTMPDIEDAHSGYCPVLDPLKICTEASILRDSWMHSPVSTVICDARGSLIEMNDAARRMFISKSCQRPHHREDSR